MTKASSCWELGRTIPSVSCCRIKRLFENGSKQMGSVAASLFDFHFQRLAGRHQRLDSLHNDSSLGEGEKRQR